MVNVEAVTTTTAAREQVHDFGVSLYAEGTSRHDEHTPYAETTTARVLRHTLEESGVELPQAYNDEERDTSSGRYGNPYARLTRQLATTLMGHRTPMESLITTAEETLDEDGYSRMHRVARPERLMTTDDEPANVVLDMINQLRGRAETRDYSGDLPLSSVAKMTHSCQDVETYFAASSRRGKLFLVELQAADGGEPRQFWHKNFGAHTYLNIEPVRIAGITLPPGFVFRKEPDGLVPMRLTGFAFDRDTAERTFGEPMTRDWHGQGTNSASDADATAAFDAFGKRRTD